MNTACRTAEETLESAATVGVDWIEFLLLLDVDGDETPKAETGATGVVCAGLVVALMIVLGGSELMAMPRLCESFLPSICIWLPVDPLGLG